MKPFDVDNLAAKDKLLIQKDVLIIGLDIICPGDVSWKKCLNSFLNFQISFHRIGLKDKSGNFEGLGEALTLNDAIEKMGDHGRRISYLKVSGTQSY